MLFFGEIVHEVQDSIFKFCQQNQLLEIQTSNYPILNQSPWIIKNMQVPKQSCSICLLAKQHPIILPTCKHVFCLQCIKGYIDTLKKYNELTPKKLMCLSEGCIEELSDSLIQQIYPGELGFVLTIVKKRYKESKDPAIKIFNCKGFINSNRSPLVDKPSTMGREIHSRLMNEKVKKILAGIEEVNLKKICTNILSFNKYNTKDKTVQCYVCGVSYCTQCEDLGHEGKCEQKKPETQLSKYIKNSLSNQETNDIESYIKANQMTKCLNPKCGLPIVKEEGCYWVKCRCSWEFCYPCQKIWGDCEHFSKYPYKKFVPPPEWMVKALNLY